MSTEETLAKLVQENARKMLELSDKFLTQAERYLGSGADSIDAANELVGAAIALRAAVVQ